MKRFIFATLIFTVLVSGCSGRNRGDSIPIHPDTYSRSTSERLSAAAPKEENAVLKEIAILKKEIASLKKKKNAVLKEENTIPSHVEICSLPSGCKSDESGKCIGCIVKKRDIGTLEFN